MRILINIDNYCDENASHDEIVSAMMDAIKGDYYDRADDCDAEILDRPNSVILGMEEPVRLIDEARRWNNDIRTELARSIELLYKKYGENLAEADLLNTVEIYRLKCAAMAANDDFYEYADQQVRIDNPYLGEHSNIWRSVLMPQELQAIIEHPENYAIFDVYVK